MIPKYGKGRERHEGWNKTGSLCVLNNVICVYM